MLRILLFISNFALILAMKKDAKLSPSSSRQQQPVAAAANQSSLNALAPEFLPLSVRQQQYPSFVFSQQFPHYAEPQFPSHHQVHHHLPSSNLQMQQEIPNYSQPQYYQELQGLPVMQPSRYFNPQKAESEKSEESSVPLNDLLPDDPFGMEGHLDEESHALHQQNFSSNLPEQQQHQPTTFGSSNNDKFQQRMLSVQSAFADLQQRQAALRSIRTSPLKGTAIAKTEGTLGQRGSEEKEGSTSSPLNVPFDHHKKAVQPVRKEDSEKGLSSAHTTSASDMGKGDKTGSLRAANSENEEGLSLKAEPMMLPSLEDEQQFGDKKPSEEKRPAKPEGSSPKAVDPIKTGSKKDEQQPAEIKFGSIDNSAIRSGLTGIEHRTQIEIEEKKMEESFVEKIEALTNVSQKHMVEDRVREQQQQQNPSSSSATKVERKPIMNIEASAGINKPSTTILTRKNVQGPQQQQPSSRPNKEQKSHRQHHSPPLGRFSSTREKPVEIPARRRVEHQRRQNNSPSSSRTATSPVASSPLSVSSMLPTSPSVRSAPSIASSHSETENAYNLLTPEGEGSQETEDSERELEEKGEGDQSEIHQKEGSAVRAPSSTGEKVKVKTKKEIKREEMKFLEKEAKRVKNEWQQELEKQRLIRKVLLKQDAAQQSEQSAAKSSPKSQVPKRSGKGAASSGGGQQDATEEFPGTGIEERQALIKQQFNAIVEQCNHMSGIMRRCERNKNASLSDEKTQELLELKSSYQEFTKLLGMFARKHLDINNKQKPLPSTMHFEEMLKMLEELLPEEVGMKTNVKTIKQIVLECLRYLAIEEVTEEGAEEQVYFIIEQFNLMREIEKECQAIGNADEKKEEELQKLKSNYQEFMKLLEKFGRNFGNNLAGGPMPPFTYFGDIMGLFELPLKDGREGSEEMTKDVLTHLVYLDENGGMAQLKEQGKQITVFDRLFESITNLNLLITKSKNANDARVEGEQETAIAMLEFWERHVANDLYEAIGYLFVNVSRERRELGRVSKCLNKFESVLPNRKDQILSAVETIRKFSRLPKLKKYSERSSPSSGTSETKILLSKLDKSLHPIGADTAASSGGSSSQIVHSSSIKIIDKGDSTTSASTFIPVKTTEEVNKSLVKEGIDLILREVKLLKNINDNCMANELPQFVKAEELERLGDKYKTMMNVLENFINIHGNDYNWNGKTHFGDIFKWICATFKTRDGSALPDPESLVDIMQKSVALLGKASLDEKWLNDVIELDKKVNNYEKDSNDQKLFRQMEIQYKVLVDPNLREILSSQFIKMPKTIVPEIQRVERIRKSVLQNGLFLVSIVVGEQRQKQFEIAQQRLERFFDTWTARMESQIRADLPGYVTKSLGAQELIGKIKSMEKLELLADEMLIHSANYERKNDDAQVPYAADLEKGIKAINQLVEGKWKPPKQTIAGGISSKRGKNKAAAKAKGKVINEFSWEPVLKDVRKLIRYISLLHVIQQDEDVVKNDVDGFHVHVRVWAILYDIVSPIINEWEHNYIVETKHQKEQRKDDNVQEVFKFLAGNMDTFLVKNDQAEKGGLITKALSTLANMYEDYSMQHRNKHLRRLLANYDPSKDGDGVEAEHFKTCTKFDHLLLD